MQKQKKRMKRVLDDNEEAKYNDRFQSIHRKKLVKLTEKTQNNVFDPLEDARCKSDLMYRLFRRPETIVAKLLKAIIEVIQEKNQPDLGKSRMFRDATAFLVDHPFADNAAKIFFVLCVVAKDTDVQSVIRKGYTKGNMWGDEANTHFSHFVGKLDALILDTMNAPFGETNTPVLVRSFVKRAEQLYLTLL